MISFPPAKINIGLNITSKRSDGYHNIESIFFPVPLCDVLEVLPGDGSGLDLEVRGIPLPEDGAENLCQKAYRLMDEEYNLPSYKAALLKNIPSGAGLGGGSSDGSAMINMLSQLADLKLSPEQKQKYAAQLGSDCPFFLDAKGTFVSGRGEELEPIPIDLTGYHICLIYPNIHIPTAKAYSLVNPKPSAFNLRYLAELPVEKWKDHAYNDFEPGIFRLHPQIEAIKHQLYKMGALYASMTGSGSTVYGLFEEKPELGGFFKDYFRWIGEL